MEHRRAMKRTPKTVGMESAKLSACDVEGTWLRVCVSMASAKQHKNSGNISLIKFQLTYFRNGLSWFRYENLFWAITSISCNVSDMSQDMSLKRYIMLFNEYCLFDIWCCEACSCGRASHKYAMIYCTNIWSLIKALKISHVVCSTFFSSVHFAMYIP